MLNTIVMSSNSKYVWGVWLLIASMRKSLMNEQVIVLADKYSEHDISVLKQFGDVNIVDNSSDSSRNLTCSKPDAMMLADTEYVTWVDCDGIFAGNCSEYLTVEQDYIHARLRGRQENNMVFAGRYHDGDEYGSIPKHILNIWGDDVGENSSPALETCVTACFISLHRKYRFFLEKWRDQINKVLPKDNVGVCDKRSTAYFQTDESVLNSLLCFGKDMPEPAPTFKLDKDPNAFYIHFAYMPKPWQMWNDYTIKHFDRTVEIVEWAVANGYETPSTIPFSLKRKYRKLNHMLAKLGKHVARAQKLLQLLRR
jgi:hypothetical protein